MTHTGQRVSFVALFVTIFIWGFAYVVTKSGLSTVPPMLFALLRYAVASVLLVPLALAAEVGVVEVLGDAEHVSARR
jgi:drug/metabolite transporter (DMT)-like permease